MFPHPTTVALVRDLEREDWLAEARQARVTNGSVGNRPDPGDARFRTLPATIRAAARWHIAVRVLRGGAATAVPVGK